jgi:hypothetical protein
VASTGADYSQFSFVDINDSGATAFGAHVTNSPSYGVFTGPSNVNDRVAGPGDQLFGKTVRDAYFRRGGLNNQGQVAFEYITTDLFDVIAVATPATMGDANVDQTVEPAGLQRAGGKLRQQRGRGLAPRRIHRRRRG